MSTPSSQPGRCPIYATSVRPHEQSHISLDEIEKLPAKPVSRRTLLKVGGVGTIATTLATLGVKSWMPKRVGATPFHGYSDIQYNIGNFIHPVQTITGIPVQFGVVYTFLAPATLTRLPTIHDRSVLSDALKTIEATYAFSPSGIFSFVSYGLPYFRRLPRSVVESHMPRLTSDPSRFVLEEAVPGPTDVSPLNPGISKRLFNVPVQIEQNDVLFTLRSDSLANITDVAAWLNGSNHLNDNSVASPAFNGLFIFGPSRLNFVQPGLPRQLADHYKATGVAPFPSFATEINPASSMWMGFVDQQISGSAPTAATVTFASANAGGSLGKLTTAKSTDYFDNGAIQHLSHVIDDLAQFYDKTPGSDEPYHERVQYMFRSKQADGTSGFPFPEDPTDPFTNGGGLGAPKGDLATQQKSAYLPDMVMGAHDIATNFDPLVTDHKKYRVGHEQGLQRSSRAADGTPLHIRIDGPGLSSLDVPDGSTQPTLEFSVFVPTSEILPRYACQCCIP